jgi:hypothetical protein
MAVLRSRLAYIIVAVLRSTPLRRVVEHNPDHHRHHYGASSSSLHPGLNTVRPRPTGLRALRVDPETPSTAQPQTSAEPPVRRAQHPTHETVATRLTNRSTSTPVRWQWGPLLGVGDRARHAAFSPLSQERLPARKGHRPGRAARPRSRNCSWRVAPRGGPNPRGRGVAPVGSKRCASRFRSESRIRRLMRSS